MSRHEARDGGSKWRVYDRDFGAGSYDLVQIYDVARTHPDASVTRRRPDEPLLRSPVNVNISSERVGVLRFHTTQPENARHDWITAWRIRCNDLTGAAPILEHCAGRRIAADFFSDLQFTERGKTAASPIS